MATIQPKISRGHKYWYIVESRRVNGKPRPIVLAYLGKAEDLLKRLQGLTSNLRIKSYSHGAVALLLRMSERLRIPTIINRHVAATRPYMTTKPTRNQLTAGMTLLLGAIGRVCVPTSKRGWWDWAKTTSCEYLLRCSLAKVDSQHFWDLMDALPMSAIPAIESELLQQARTVYPIDDEILSFDTTNFFTFIATTNTHCTLAQRGKNKQKRSDLRQVGMALVVTRSGGIPIFHLTYQGNRNDSKIFLQVIRQIKERLQALSFDLDKHTLVFDRGNNSKANLAEVAKEKLHYVGALTPYQHRQLLEEAEGNYLPVNLGDSTLDVYRTKKIIWGEERTVLVFVSQRLKAGQLRGIYQDIDKKTTALRRLQKSLTTVRGAVKDQNLLASRVAKTIHGQFLDEVFLWRITPNQNNSLELDFSVNQQRLRELEDEIGFRIIMTDRHDWDSPAIIQAFYGQAAVEQAFKSIKNPYHLAVRPQFHWTDQKIAVHFFLCLLGYLLASLLWAEARRKAGFHESLDNLLDRLNQIRLASLIEVSGEKGKPKATYQLEEMSPEDRTLFHALDGDDLHINRPHLAGVGVYE